MNNASENGGRSTRKSAVSDVAGRVSANRVKQLTENMLFEISQIRMALDNLDESNLVDVLDKLHRISRNATDGISHAAALKSAIEIRDLFTEEN